MTAADDILFASTVAALTLAGWLDWKLHRAVRDALAWRTVAARWHGEAEVEERLAEAWCALYEGAAAVTEAEAGR